MLPTLRLGFVVVPEALRRAVHAAKYVTDWHTVLPTQMALARFIDQGLLARHVRRMRSVYQVRHQTIVDLLTDQFAEVVTLVPSAAGLHVSAESDHLSPDEVRAAARRAQASGVVMHRLAMFRIDQPARAGLVLGYGAIDTPRIAEGMRRLRRAFDPGRP